MRAAAALLAEGGRDAVTARAVSHAAGVKAPTLYRQFGDMRGILDAAVSHGFAIYLRGKTGGAPAVDPVDDLRHGWDLHVAFGLSNPAVYALMFGEPRPGADIPAAREAATILRGLVQRVAEAGRLRVGVEPAARMIHAATVGVTLTLLATAPEDRDPTTSPATREAILAAVTTDGAGAAAQDPEASRAASHAVALRATLAHEPAGFTPGELTLLGELLDRLAASGRDRGRPSTVSAEREAQRSSVRSGSG